MRKLFYLLFVSVFAFSFIGCDDKDDDNEWRDLNIAAYNKIVSNSEYSHVTVPEGPTGTYRKIINKGNGTEYPINTSKVKVYYKGYLYDGTVFDNGTSITERPAEFELGGSSVVRGFSVAIQNMVVGDKWEIVIPYHLGYGTSKYGSIPGYTTLFFEVELLEIDRYPHL